MKIRHVVNPRISDDENGDDLLFGLSDKLAEVVIESYTLQTSGKFSVAATATDTLPLGDITSVKGLFLKVDADCVIKLNGSTDEIQIRKASDADTARLFLEADINSVEITAGAEILAGTFCVWGE